MGRNKMIAKSCPKCEMQVAVASKSCKCGHTFFASRRAAEQLSPAPEELRRRTARVSRAQTQFYDGQHYQKQKRRNKKRSDSKSADDYVPTTIYNYYKPESKREKLARERRARRRSALADAQPGPRRDHSPLVPPEQLRRCQTALLEINRKMAAVMWRPPPDPPATTSSA